MRQRLRQFFEAGRQPTEGDWALARSYLSPPLFELFAAQHPRDVVHGAATARWLLDRGHDDADLLTAALAHDIGKGPQRRLDRVAFVAAGALGVAGLAADTGSRFELRRALERTRTHSETGAGLLEQAGASPRAVALTRAHHAARPDDPVLALLQRADAAS